FCWSVWAKLYKKENLLKSFDYFDIYERLCYGEDVFFNYINFIISESFFVSKECFYHYEFSEFGRYENKNKEILYQNYKDKKRSFELIKKLSNNFNHKEFNKKLLEILEMDLINLKNRL
ncbi:glycosyltransferase family 2 protein, partial [Campylobacter lari]|nr:glycosyltransferase family 2 protein [Campylobacter lari]